GHRTVRLGELLKEPFAHFLRDTGTGVLHFKAQARLTGLRIFDSLNGDLHRDAALVRELDGIAEEIEQDLPQPRRVAAIDAPRSRIDKNAQIDALFASPGGHQ